MARGDNRISTVESFDSQLNAAVESLESQFGDYVNRLVEQLVLARQRNFGVSSEQRQGRLFDEAEALAADTTETQDIAPVPAAPVASEHASLPPNVKARGKRAPLPTELPRVVVVHDVPEAERTCPCGTPMIEIGRDISEQLDIVPMQIRVLVNTRIRYGCPKSLHA